MHLEAGGCVFRGESVVELGEHAIPEADHAHHAVLQVRAPHAPLRRHGDDGGWLVVEHETQRVGVVDRDVEHDPAARLRPLDPPALQMGRQIDGMKDAREERLADAALLDRLAHRAMRRGVAQVMVRRHHDAALVAFGDHRPRLGERQRQRLLAEHMLSARRRGEDLIAMQFVGGGDIDRVDVRSNSTMSSSRVVAFAIRCFAA